MRRPRTPRPAPTEGKPRLAWVRLNAYGLLLVTLIDLRGGLHA